MFGQAIFGYTFSQTLVVIVKMFFEKASSQTKQMCKQLLRRRRLAGAIAATRLAELVIVDGPGPGLLLSHGSGAPQNQIRIQLVLGLPRNL